MAKERKNEKIMTLVLAIIISIAALTIIYVSLPDDSETDTADQDDNNGVVPPVEENILTLIYGEEELEYTLTDLEEMEAYVGNGSQLKIGALPDIIIKGPYNFTGVKFTTLLSELESLPENYNLTITSTDGWTDEFTKNHVEGVINIYNETGNITGNSGATMILAYKEDGEYITDEEDGPTRVAFVGEDVITASNMWAKMVASIEIVEV
jgi:hypothetical protein